MASNTGAASAGEALITRRISAVAACCSCASALSRIASARRFSKSRTLAPLFLGDLGATAGLASLDFAGFGPRRIGLPLLLMNRPGTGYGEHAGLSKWVGRLWAGRLFGSTEMRLVQLC